MSDNDKLKESLRVIAKGAGISFIGTLIGIVFGFFTRIVIARFLNPDEYGLISLGLAALNIAVMLGLMGLRTGIVRYVSYYRSKKDDARLKGTIVSALMISFPLSIILAFLLFFYAKWLSVNLFQEPRLTPILQIFSISLPFWVLAQIFLPVTVGFQNVKYKVFTEDIFHNFFKLSVIALLLYFGYGVLEVAFGWMFSIIVMALLAFYYLEKKVFSILNTKIRSVSVRKELLSFSIPLIFATATGLILAYTDTLMLGFFRNAYDVGIYNVALPTAGLLRVVFGSFGVIIMPVISGLFAQKRISELNNIYSTITKWILSIVFPAFLLMILFAKQVIWVFFGSDYVIGATALVILAFGYFVTSVFGTAERIITASGNTRITMGCVSLGSLVNFFLNIYLIPIFGINGAAIATSISFIIIYSLMVFYTYKLEKIQPFRINFLKPVTAAAISCFLVFLISIYLPEVTVLILVLLFILFILVYFIFLLVFGEFDENDLMIIKAIEERTGVKWKLLRRIIARFI